jgi:hypothetical protein
VTDLSVSGVTPRTAALRWTAPSHGDEDGGIVYQYDLRRAPAPVTDATWTDAEQVPNEPAPLPPGYEQTVTVYSLAPGSTVHFALRSRDDLGTWSSLSNSATAALPEENEVVFPDSALDGLIRGLIQKPVGPIYPDDLVGILEIEAESRGIGDLTGIAACTNAWRLNASLNHVSDLAPLAGMAGIRSLGLMANRISDLDPLATLSGLTYLGLGQNQIDDLGPLAALTNLDALSFAENRVSDLTPLAGLGNLTYIYMNGNQIIDLGPISGLTSLTELYVAASPLADLSPLAGLTELQFIQLDFDQITDLAPLVANPGIGTGDTIWIRGNPLSQEAIETQIPALEARGATVVTTF